MQMTCSEKLDKFLPDWHKAQQSIEVAHKGGKNPHFNSTYARLGDVMKAIKPALQANSLSFAQMPYTTVDGGVGVTTVIYHTSGQFISSSLTLKPKSSDPQAYGSAISYAKRYALAAMCGVDDDEDDDGNKASASSQSHPASDHEKPVGTPLPSNPTATPPPPQKSFQPMSDDRKAQKLVTDGQIKRLYAIAKQRAWDQNEVKDLSKRAFGITSFSALNMRDYDALVQTIESTDYRGAIDALNFEDSQIPSVGKVDDSGIGEIPF